MSFIKKYWITEIGLGLITLGGLGVAGYNIIGANNQGNTNTESTFFTAEADKEDIDMTAVQSDTQMDEEDSGFMNEAADEMADEMDDEADGDEDDMEMGDEDDHEVEGGDIDEPLDVAAQAIGLDIETLEEGMVEGKSIADVITEKGGDVQGFIEAMIAAEIRLAELELQTGEISAEDAAEWQAEIAEWVPFMVSTPYQEPTMIAAQQLNIEIDSLWEKLEEGETITALAQAQNIAPESIIEMIKVSESAYLDAMVEAGLIDAEELNDARQEAIDFATIVVNSPLSQWEEGDEGEDEDEMDEDEMDEDEDE